MPQAQAVREQLEAASDTLQANWCVPRETGRVLHTLALIANAQNIVEVGTSIGYSTLWLADACEKTGGTVHTLEYFEARQQQAIQNVAQAGLDHRVQFYLGAAIDLLKQFAEKNQTFDFAFIDAAKAEYIEYIWLLEPMMPAGAVLVADNTRSHRDEMKDFLAYMNTSPAFDVAEIESPNGQLLARKR